MTIAIAFGAALKEFRKKEKLSQESLAHTCELDRTYISLLERGRRQPTLETLFKLADALRIKPSEFIKIVENNISRGDLKN